MPLASSIAHIPDTQLSKQLVDGESAHVYLAFEDISAQLLKNGVKEEGLLYGRCEDSAGNTSRSAGFRFTAGQEKKWSG